MLSLADILEKGYFPRELPPPFSTNSFAAAATPVAGMPSALAAAPTQIGAGLGVHNMMRAGGLRRHLGIPNPIYYLRLCDFVVGRWQDLSNHAKASPFSLSQPIEGKPTRALSPQFSLDERTLKRAELRASARFVLHTDVNRFYPSIYTHSIPWSIHGKTAVKAAMAAGKLRKNPAVWADELDIHLRSINENQTMGIPIGPDCSLLVAEILLASVDLELTKRQPSLRGIRFIDDYEFAADQRSDAEQTASVLQSILSHYGLALNPTKTQIIELPQPLEPLWTSRIRTYLFRFGGVKTQANDFTAYFDNVFDLLKKNPEEPILKYAVARLNSVDIGADNWPLYERLLCHSSVVEPACLPQVCEQMTYYQTLGYPVNSSLWRGCLNRIVEERLPLGQASEPVWAMWLMKLLGLSLNRETERAIDGCEDSAAALMGLGLASVGLANFSSFQALNLFAEGSDLFSQHWLLCYEGNHRGWITPPSGNSPWVISQNFEYLHKANVSFFDITTTPPAPRRLSGDPLALSTTGSDEYPL
jgi:hypothetical protein